MNLRAITISIPMNKLNIDKLHSQLQPFLDDMSTALQEREIRTFRINLSPIQDTRKNVDQQDIITILHQVSELSERLNIRWFNVPFDLANSKNPDQMIDLALDVLKQFPKTFINLIVADKSKINYKAITKASKFIKDVSRLDNSGYNNFRVGISCNIRPNTPFFPFTYSSNILGFSIALELPREFIKIITSTKTEDLLIIRNKLLEKLIPDIQEIQKISRTAAKKNHLEYHGIDVSLAPYPEKGSSVAELMELLGIEQQGSNGTLFLTSYLTDILKTIIKEGKIKNAGFSGVMFSLLEDEFMGRRNNNNLYSVDSLISYSAVCGCGLDMVPLPGDTFEEEISSIILDVAALSTVLNKPLGVRLLPIPMKNENEFTIFNMDFLYNTRIKKIKNHIFFNKSLSNKDFIYKGTKNDRK